MESDNNKIKNNNNITNSGYIITNSNNSVNDQNHYDNKNQQTIGSVECKPYPYSTKYKHSLVYGGPNKSGFKQQEYMSTFKYKTIKKNKLKVESSLANLFPSQILISPKISKSLSFERSLSKNKKSFVIDSLIKVVMEDDQAEKNSGIDQ
ncbi:hypothetical protein CYY_001250 [Polysphondylium violaceum]|uniref:Uncharacterized protein n=1 Tax=Polysphondylium violaceum TaxID=133409 RepID=A0A8J4V853_9MYCE|nr:hypothetical protein CYY_001250 [Polysphondylium violaceum]